MVEITRKVTIEGQVYNVKWENKAIKTDDNQDADKIIDQDETDSVVLTKEGETDSISDAGIKDKAIAAINASPLSTTPEETEESGTAATEEAQDPNPAPAAAPKPPFSGALEILADPEKVELARIQLGYLQTGTKAQKEAANTQLKAWGFSEKFIDAMKDGEITFKEFKKELGVDNETYYYWINSHCGQISTTDKTLTIDELVLIANEIKTLSDELSTSESPISFSQLAAVNEKAVAFRRVPLNELKIAKDEIGKWSDKDLETKLQVPIRNIVERFKTAKPEAGKDVITNLLVRCLLASLTGTYSTDWGFTNEDIEALKGLHRYNPSKITSDNMLEWLETGTVSEEEGNGDSDEAINRAAKAINKAKTAAELNTAVSNHSQIIKKNQQLIETVLERTAGSPRGTASVTDNPELAQSVTKTVLAWLPNGQTKFDNTMKLAVAMAEKGNSAEAFKLVEENIPTAGAFKFVTDPRKGESLISGQLEAKFIVAVAAGDTTPMDNAISGGTNVGLAHYYRAQTKVEENAFDDYESAARSLTATDKETVDKRKECLSMMLNIYQTKSSMRQNAEANKLKDRYNKLLKEIKSGSPTSSKSEKTADTSQKKTSKPPVVPKKKGDEFDPSKLH